MENINGRVLSGIGAIGLNIVDILDHLNSIVVFTLSVLTMIYIGYGIYKRTDVRKFEKKLFRTGSNGYYC